MENSEKPSQVDVLKGHLKNLTEIGLALSGEKDINKLLEMVVDQARALSGADAGTLYVLDSEERSLRFAVLQNDSLNMRISGGKGNGPSLPPIPLYRDGEPNHSNVSSHVALTGEIANIPDVYEAKGFDFTGPKKYDESTGYRTRSMVVIPMKNHENEVIGVLQLLNARDASTGEITLFSDELVHMTAALASVAAVSLTNTRLIEALSTELERTQKLQETEKELNQKIRYAYLDIEESNKRLRDALRRVRVIRILIIIFVVVLVIGGGGYYAWNRLFFQENFPTGPSPAAGLPQPGTGPTYRVSPQPISASISLSGKVEPLKEVSVISPFTGKVKEKRFEYGQEVAKGDLLISMDTRELEVQIREAKAGFIKSQQEFGEVNAWETSPEVSRAKRAMTKARRSLESGKRKLKETLGLFEKGIIPRSEYESAQVELVNLEHGLQSAEEELASILEKGSRENVNMARLRLENARIKLKELEEKQSAANVYAPVSGIVILPVASGLDKPKIIQEGVETTQGEILMSVGNLEGFSVKAKVDEVDIFKIKVGQEVKVSGDAFPDLSLKGKVTHISSQAGKGDYADVPMFDVIVTIESLNPEQKGRLRLGMTCSLEVMVYENPGALLIPLPFVHTDGRDRWVFVKDMGTGEPRKVPVKTGMTTIDSVEILKGLKEGDEVMM